MQTDIFKEQNKDNMKKFLADCKVDFTESLEYPPVALSLGDKVMETKEGNLVLPIPIGTYGNFSMISAPAKTKKTFFLSLLVSAYLSGGNPYTGKIKGHRGDKSVLHFDTEQGEWHCHRTFKRAFEMSNIEDSEKYHTFGLRTIGWKNRIPFIEHCLKENKNVGLVCIDGVADLISDINNVDQANECAEKLMELSGKYKCHIITIIHSNHGSDKARGHLGTFLMNKTETEIRLEQNSINTSWVTVSCKMSRGYSFESFSFKVNNYGYPEVINDFYDPLADVR
tara:strand:+ start:3072 stop:3917 length:846 start_codon:yes stop_codon:yes gene_type:complete